MLLSSANVFAQNDNPQDSQNENTDNTDQHYGFDRHKLFAGGSLNLGFGSGNGVSTFVIGALPEVGYTVKEWFDVGLAFNINYYSGTQYVDPNNSYNDVPGYKAVSYGAGIFARVHPFEQFFIQIQPEIDNYSVKETLTGYNPQKYFHTSTSYLGGIGWGQRIVGESSFYTLLMVDFGSEKNTPYKDGQGNVLPVIRAGFNIYF